MIVDLNPDQIAAVILACQKRLEQLHERGHLDWCEALTELRYCDCNHHDEVMYLEEAIHKLENPLP